MRHSRRFLWTEASRGKGAVLEAVELTGRDDATREDAPWTVSLAEIAQRTAVPPQFWSILSRICEIVADVGCCDLFLLGSLQGGTADELSDIDLRLICSSSTSRDMLEDRLHQALRDAGRILAHFPATHIGMPDLSINFLEVDGVLIKVDIEYSISPSKLGQSRGIPLVRRRGQGAGILPSRPSDPRSAPLGWLGDIHSKFSGWIWYTHTKIVRGEYWEANDSLSVMRARALLPLLLFVRGLPQEGYRRIETRVSAPERVRLERTRASVLEAEALVTALREMADFFEALLPEAVAKAGSEFRTADLRRIRALAAL